MTSVAALLASHNRRELTLRCLGQIADQRPEGVEFHTTVFLVDDGSTDGTAEAVADRFPDVVVIAADGSLYWNRSMHLAWTTALERGPFDHYLMLNDDTFLRPGAFAEALSLEAEATARGERAVVVGTTVDPDTGELTYGAFVPASRWNRLKMRHHMVGDPAEPVTMNGNFVLVPHAVVDEIGIIDAQFAQSFGDIDLGFRATDAGVRLVPTRAPVGECAPNPTGSNGHLHTDYSLSERIAHVRGVKGLNGDDWRRVCRDHAGPWWPVVWVGPYVHTVTGWAGDRVRGLRSGASG